MALFDRNRPDVDELARMDLFRGLPEGDLAEIQNDVQRFRIKAGKVVMLERFHGEQFLVILDGHVVVTRGGEHVASLGPGDFIGEIGMLSGSDRTASVFAKRIRSSSRSVTKRSISS
jgi:CRP-like cAMP-binding protein